MKRVGRDASLDEASVSQAEQRQADWSRPRLRAVPAPTSPVTVTRVDPRVWTEALRLAGGDAQRIQVHGPTEVTVHNAAWRNQKGIPS